MVLQGEIACFWQSRRQHKRLFKPDRRGERGIRSLLQNNGIRVQDRKAKELKFVTRESFFSAAGPYRSIVFAPRAAFDVNARRFVLAAVVDRFETTAALAISADMADALGYLATQNYLFSLTNVYPDNASLAYQIFEDGLELNAPSSPPNPDTTRILFVNNIHNLSNGNYLMAFKEVRIAPGGGLFKIGPRTGTDAGDTH